MKGRLPVPASLNILHGNPSRRPISEFELKIPIAKPPPPKDLDLNARKEWKRIVRVLADNRMITDLDLTILTTYCYNFSQWIKMIKELEKGLIIKSPSGWPMQSPYFNMLKKTEGVLMKCMQELGLSPVARARLKHSISPESKDDFDDFLNKK